MSVDEPLEKIFREVEEENERRAQEEMHDSVSSRITRVDSSDNLKKRRRGSISISRFGQLSSSDHLSVDGSPSAPLTPALSDIASKTPFFQQQMRNGSQTSFASGGSAGEDAHEEDHHVTQMHTIGPRQSISRAVGGLLPRRLSRARSSVLPSAGESSGGNVVIGVSVQAATVETPENGELGATVIHAPGALRNQASKGSLTSNFGKKSWALIAKNFTKKFRRKSSAALTTPPA
ncbi:hypothetical protein C8J57DRAFT_1500159 [Mycena rebaudengoi]|nr:hypothetical protein C8J57DRAFT_1500159 [Mycena rebaudengoi]